MTRRHFTAQGTFPLIQTPHLVGSLHTKRPPMGGARRQSIYGRVLPMERPLKDEGTGYDHLPIWDEQPPIWKALTVILAVLIVAILGIVAWS